MHRDVGTFVGPGAAVLAVALVTSPAQAAPQSSGVAAVRYRVPIEAPTGDVQVLSLGVADLPVPSLIGTERFVHIRLAATNWQDELFWIVDARDQRLELADGSFHEPRFAEASPGGGPARLSLRRGERGYLDLFFPVADGVDPHWTSLTWFVRRGSGAMVATTVFERLPPIAVSYSHYSPLHYRGGHVLLGDVWCAPRWHGAGWMQNFAPYRRYRYTRRQGGVDVFDGWSVWAHDRDRSFTRQVTLGDRWAGVPARDRPHRAWPSGAPGGERWGGAPPGDAPPRVGSSAGRERWVGSPPSAAPTRTESTSDSSSWSAPTSATVIPPAPAPSSADDSVGSRWRSAR